MRSPSCRSCSSSPARADFELQRENTRAFFDPVVDIEIPGADRAYSGGDAILVAMQVGDSFVQVSNFGIGDADDVTVPLAAIVAGRLRQAQD